MTTGAARVVMFSQRNLYELEVWRSGLREFEELIRGFDAVDLVAPHRGRWFAQRKRLALRVGRATDVVLNAGVPRVRLDRDYELFFAIVEKPGELLNVHSLEGWKDRCRTSICWLNELWVKEMRWHRSSLKVLSDFDYVLSPLAESVDAINRVIRGRCIYVPQSADAIALLPYPQEVTRSIDVLSVGRRSQDVHQALLSLAREGKIFYVYDTLTNLHTDDIDGHRFLVTNLLKRSKYFVVHPAKWDRPDERGEQSEIGSRYFEGAASGTIMIGTPPTTPEFARVLSWPEAVVPLPSDADGIAQRLRELEQQPERQQHIRRTNTEQSLLRHDWAYRWETIVTLAGLKPMPELIKRKARLAELAEMVRKGVIKT